MEKSNRNVFLDVELKNPAQPVEEADVIQAPPEPKPEPEEEKIFKPVKKDLVLQKPEEKKKYDRKTNAKREVTPKMRAHLERIRGLAKEAKEKKKREKMGAIEEEPEPQPKPEPVQPQTIPQQSVASVAPVANTNIDYDRIINGIWQKQQQQTQFNQQLQQAKEQIRQEERKKALEESRTLFTQAYQAHQKKQSQNIGLQALRGFTPQHNHPVFKQKNQPQYQNTSNNPFDACFK